MMNRCMLGLLVSVALLAAGASLAQEDKRVHLAGWGIDDKNLEPFMAAAAAVGFDTLITWTTDPVILTRDVAAGAKHGLRIFSCLSPMGRIGDLWHQRYPARPIPWQVMTEDEEAARRFLLAGKNQYLIPYQFGGEPKLTNEVLTTRIICFSDREARELFKPVIDSIAAVPGIGGLAFDGFGYENYRRCYCARCQGLLDEYRKTHLDVPVDQSEAACFREALVGYVNYLADYARARQPGLKTSIHIWPVFAPDPLYGNRLDVDFCGQTAAWYTLWPEEKIAEYSRLISGEARKYYPRQQGVGMIGYYDRPGQFPVKDAARVDLELRTMLANGLCEVQVCSALDVVRNPAIAAVFRKYCH